MKPVLFLLVAVAILSCRTDTWRIHREKINTGFTIEYSIPSKWKSNRIENGFCIGPPPRSEEEEQKLVKDAWCVWMSSPNEESIEEDISYFKGQFNNRVKETRSKINVAGCIAQRITLNGENGQYKEIIYFTKANTLFVINNSKRADEGFRKFYFSIRVF